MEASNSSKKKDKPNINSNENGFPYSNLNSYYLTSNYFQGISGMNYYHFDSSRNYISKEHLYKAEYPNCIYNKKEKTEKEENNENNSISGTVSIIKKPKGIQKDNSSQAELSQMNTIMSSSTKEEQKTKYSFSDENIQSLFNDNEKFSFVNQNSENMNIFNFLPKRIDLTKYYDSLPEELIENIFLDRDEKYGYLLYKVSYIEESDDYLIETILSNNVAILAPTTVLFVAIP